MKGQQDSRTKDGHDQKGQIAKPFMPYAEKEACDYCGSPITPDDMSCPVCDIRLKRELKENRIVWLMVALIFVAGVLFTRHGVWGIEIGDSRRQLLLMAVIEAAILAGFSLVVINILRMNKPRTGFGASEVFWWLFHIGFLFPIVFWAFNTGHKVTNGLELLYESAGTAMLLSMAADAVTATAFRGRQSGKSFGVSFIMLWLACLVAALLPKF